MHAAWILGLDILDMQELPASACLLLLVGVSNILVGFHSTPLKNPGPWLKLADGPAQSRQMGVPGLTDVACSGFESCAFVTIFWLYCLKLTKGIRECKTK